MTTATSVVTFGTVKTINHQEANIRKTFTLETELTNGGGRFIAP